MSPTIQQLEEALETAEHHSHSLCVEWNALRAQNKPCDHLDLLCRRAARALWQAESALSDANIREARDRDLIDTIA